MAEIIHKELKGKIIGSCMEVHKELGFGFLENVYEKSIVIALRDRGLNVIEQKPLEVLFKNSIVGEYYADIVVENRIIIELKTVKLL